MSAREAQLLTYYLLLKATLEYLSPLLKSAKNEHYFLIYSQGVIKIYYIYSCVIDEA